MSKNVPSGVLVEKIIRIRTRKSLKINDSSREFIEYRNAQQVGILFSAADRQTYENVKEFASELEEAGKRVKVLSMLSKGTENYEFKFDIFRASDFSIWGTIKSETIQDFIDTKFDYLYYLDAKPQPVMEYLLSRCRAKCRVGKYIDGKSSYYELMVKPEQSDKIASIIKEMHHYTRKLN